MGEDAYAALVEDLRFLKEMRAAGQVGTRLNYELSGTRSMFTKAARKAPKLKPPFKDAMLKLDEDWGSPETLVGDAPGVFFLYGEFLSGGA